MKRIFLLLFVLSLYGTSLRAQIKQSDILGVWNVTEVKPLTEIPEDQAEAMAAIMTAFKEAVFTFSEDHSFSMDLALPEMNIQNAHWRYDSESKSFIIQEWEDKDTDEYLLMEMIVGQQEDQTIFLIEELPLLLLVSRE